MISGSEKPMASGLSILPPVSIAGYGARRIGRALQCQTQASTTDIGKRSQACGRTRAPKIAVPTLTWVAPNLIAVS